MSKRIRKRFIVSSRHLAPSKYLNSQLVGTFIVARLQLCVYSCLPRFGLLASTAYIGICTDLENGYLSLLDAR